MGDRPPPFVFAGPPGSRAIPIVNPKSGEILLPRAVLAHQPTTKDSNGNHRLAKTKSIPVFGIEDDSVNEDSGHAFNVSTPPKAFNGNHSLSALAKTKRIPVFGIEEDSGDEDSGHAFNAYARPFVPQALTIINQLSGHEINTPPTKRIEFKTFVSGSFGLDFLPPIPTSTNPPLGASFILRDRDIDTHYESYFRYHLDAEIKSQKEENESYSLFEHEVTPLPFETGPIVYSILVPGLRENSPYLEEDDIVQLRQLRYDHTGKLLGMKEWLARYGQFATAAVRSGGQPAPGWSGNIFNARVLVVQRKQNMIIVKIDGLWEQNSSLDMQSTLWRIKNSKYNIQFPVTMERYISMQQALTMTQENFWQIRRNRNQDQNTNELLVNSSGSPNLNLSQIQHPWLQSMLLPTEANCEMQNTLNPGSFNRSFFDGQLNWEQKKAIESICLHNYGTLPFLVSGPPGTGKTKTLVEVALQLLQNVNKLSHILFCAPSDPAADTIIQRISAHMKPNELFRLNRPSRTFAEVPDSVMPFCCVSKDKFDLPTFKQIMSYKLVVTTCRDASLLLHARLTNSDLYAVENGLYTSIHPYDTQLSQVNLHWTALLIDEAAQAMEPEALIPLSIVAPPLESKKLAFEPLFVMAGDQHQLGPRTSRSISLLKSSLFKRLFERSVYADHPLARGKTGEAPLPLSQGILPISRPAFANLIRNYRSHPAILAVPSALFYHDTLEPEAGDINRLASWPEWRGRRWPVLFYNNDSEDDLEMDFGGWYNTGEAHIACRYAANLVGTGLVRQNEVCIMSPFKAQVLCLRKTIRDPKYGSLWEIDIGPTEAFQGLERGVVILCTTRSKQRFVKNDKEVDWGIIGMPNRMNVAITRAKFGLVVIGKREVLYQDPNWKAFLGFCDRNGLVAGKTDVGGQLYDRDSMKPTGLEKVLRSQERDVNNSRVLNGAIQDDEMWTSGMQATLDMTSDDEYEHNDEDD